MQTTQNKQKHSKSVKNHIIHHILYAYEETIKKEYILIF